MDTSDKPAGCNLEIDPDEAAHDRSDRIDRPVLELAGEDGIPEVLREDRESILVRAPSWNKDELGAWLTQRI